MWSTYHPTTKVTWTNAEDDADNDAEKDAFFREFYAMGDYNRPNVTLLVLLKGKRRRKTTRTTESIQAIPKEDGHTNTVLW